ncbi:MAG TPA: DCC1-like thiol-disulfide oxidoreductase family protein [Ferruginibacter sp.]|nr:DCC1-like thiol-disulfide oxidoreductase family protein [Ferruginibacter sp.]
MKASKIIIYDDGCPLCAAYTSAFVAAGILNEQGRKNFSNIDAATFELIDKAKCKNEIPLIDTETKQVWYGIEALLELLGSKIPIVKLIGNIKPVKWLLHKIYRFISYNRKVIVGIALKNGYDCSPDFNIKYRILFLVCFFSFNTLMLLPLHNSVFSNSFIGGSSFVQLQTAHFILVAVNVLTAALLGLKKGIEYLGQVNMLALTSILLIIPLYFIKSYTNFSDKDINNFYLGFTAMVIVQDYIRRMKYALILPKQWWIVVINIISLLTFFIYLVY